jgi:hypothetical protein
MFKSNPKYDILHNTLVGSGAGVDIPNKNGTTIRSDFTQDERIYWNDWFYEIVISDMFDMVIFYIKGGGDPNRKIDNVSPLEIASPKMMALLLELSVDVNTVFGES